MSIDLQYFKEIQGASEISFESDIRVSEAKRRLKRNLAASINCVPNHNHPVCRRNGVDQRFVVSATQNSYKYNILAFPDEELNSGDIIECFGEFWIVVEIKVGNPLQRIGVMWLCNYVFRWQNNTSEIFETHGVLDSGVYSTTIEGTSKIQNLNKQYKIYLPYNENSKKMYVDKRIAVGTSFDANGNEILTCYKITGEDPVSRSYGSGGHLLVLNVVSDLYNSETDNLEELVCDYTAPSESNEDDSVSEIKISGRDSIAVGGSRSYSAVAPGRVSVLWSISSVDGVDLETDGLTCTLSAQNLNRLVGSRIVLTAQDTAGIYRAASMEIEVTTNG